MTENEIINELTKLKKKYGGPLQANDCTRQALSNAIVLIRENKQLKGELSKLQMEGVLANEDN